MGEDVWFVHSGGLVRYDGLDLEEHELRREDLKAVLDLYVASAGQVCVLTLHRFIGGDEAEILEFENMGNDIMTRDGTVEDDAGTIFLLPMGEPYVFSDSELAKVETETKGMESFLIDAAGNLWSASTDSNRIGVHRVVASDQTVRLDLLRPFESSNDGNPRLFLDSRDRVSALDLEDFEESTYVEEESVSQNA